VSYKSRQEFCTFKKSLTEVRRWKFFVMKIVFVRRKHLVFNGIDIVTRHSGGSKCVPWLVRNGSQEGWQFVTDRDCSPGRYDTPRIVTYCLDRYTETELFRERANRKWTSGSLDLPLKMLPDRDGPRRVAKLTRIVTIRDWSWRPVTVLKQAFTVWWVFVLTKSEVTNIRTISGRRNPQTTKRQTKINRRKKCGNIPCSNKMRPQTFV